MATLEPRPGSRVRRLRTVSFEQFMCMVARRMLVPPRACGSQAASGRCEWQVRVAGATGPGISARGLWHRPTPRGAAGSRAPRAAATQRHCAADAAGGVVPFLNMHRATIWAVEGVRVRGRTRTRRIFGTIQHSVPATTISGSYRAVSYCTGAAGRGL
ncbi:hypothetical protein WOLCODRAFT_152729 [Wolfiporia cocos MD-104 SS10]|uniref:Uncharacterized protein n=1 Tax=Wolfiporia cocos (strain MD-104) TaxID=742152 RepID=A0A2H3K105_WOLCO|nr:hypothetical protein WOLCODRAFT_152729 [Wolfiporia cocos MD-104 SS10]